MIIKSKSKSIILPGLAFLAALTAAIALRPTPERVYTVAQVQDGWRHHPKTWAGRIILVRGSITPDWWVPGGGMPLGDDFSLVHTIEIDNRGQRSSVIPWGGTAAVWLTSTTSTRRLELEVREGQHWSDWLASIPVIGYLTSDLRRINVSELAVYRIHLLYKSTCPMIGNCYDGVLLAP